jgi:hypothetical protein
MFRVRVWDGVLSDFVQIEYENIPLTDERDYRCIPPGAISFERAVRISLALQRAKTGNGDSPAGPQDGGRQPR